MTDFESNPKPAPSWMDEAHRRADASEDSATTLWDGGNPRPRAEFSAAAVVAVIGFGWLTYRGAIDVGSSAWQGFMLDGSYPVPIFAQWLTSATGWLEPPTQVIALNILTRLLGALSCAGVAAMCVNAARRVGTVGEAWICGVLAGIIFILAQDVTSAFTASWPGAITVACAILGMASLTRALQSRSNPGLWLTIGAGLCAAAAANHAFFGWLAIPVIGVAGFALRRNAMRVTSVVGAAFVFTVTLSLPAILALVIRGEIPASFLGRVLRGPYPALGERAPDWNVILRIGEQFHPLVWILAAAAAILVFQRFSRTGVIAAVALFIAAGPLAPSLMNHYDRDAFLRDDVSLEIIAIAGFAITFGLGLAASMQVVFRRAHSLGYRAAMAMLVLLILALHQLSIAPDRRSGLSGAFAQTMLDGCPRNGILVVQDPVVAGMLITAQHAYGHRRDVRVVPFGVLTHPAARHYYNQVHPNGIHIDTAYDTEDHATKWQRERPMLAEVLTSSDHDSKKRRSALDDLTLWEFVRDNIGARPVAFAGIEAEWIQARAAVNGLVQVYPRVEAPLTDSFEAWLALHQTEDVMTRDPELARAFSRILLSLSATCRAQNRGEEATRLAALATQFEHGNAKAWIALARAAARNGYRDDAEVYSSTGLRIGDGNAEETEAILERDLESYDLVADYIADLKDWSALPEDRLRRQKMAADLWGRDEIAVLAVLMKRELELEPPTAPNLYEVAATQAQLGDFPSARAHLRDAIALAPEKVADRLRGDGRFVLLQLDHLPSPYETSL